MVSIHSLAGGSRTYQASTSLVLRYIPIDALNHHVGIDRQLGLKGPISKSQTVAIGRTMNT